MKTYSARSFGNAFVISDGERRELPPRLDLRRFALAYSWGYIGFGPSQLALAILCDIFDDDKALRLCQQFVNRAIAKQDRHCAFEMPLAKVLEVVEQIETETV